MRRISSVWGEKQLFFARWIKSPLTLGAILPSSKNLSRFVASSVLEENRALIRQKKYVLEIGAGTGSFTSALLEAGIPCDQIISVELDPKLFPIFKNVFLRSKPLSSSSGHGPKHSTSFK